MYRTIIAGALVALASSTLVSRLQGQGSTSAMSTPLGLGMSRMGSGTTWVPESAPIASAETMLGSWHVTGHGFAFGQYIKQGGPRGDKQFGSLNWAMIMASRSIGSGLLQLRSMLSLDAATVSRRGYPRLLQTGESFEGVPLHDRQHPHDFLMELSAIIQQPVSPAAAIELYVAPAGEPALGPVAFMHRPSAMDSPFAPLSHHWQDATHITFGVATVGIFTRTLKAEASIFNGREPDDERWDFDFGRLDSYSGRLTYNPDRHWSMTAGAGRIRMEDDSEDRVVASLLHGKAIGDGAQWASSLVYGANKHVGDEGWSQALLVESEAVLSRRHTVFGRVEYVQKSVEDLVLVDSMPGFDAHRTFGIAAISLGYIHEIARARGVTLGLGGQGTVNIVPEALSTFYGSRNPVGLSVFLRVRPAAAAMPMAHDMMEMSTHGGQQSNVTGGIQ